MVFSCVLHGEGPATFAHVKVLAHRGVSSYSMHRDLSESKAMHSSRLLIIFVSMARNVIISYCNSTLGNFCRR